MLDRDRYAADVREMVEAQRRRVRPRGKAGGVSPVAAVAIAGVALALAAVVGRRYSPSRSHPDIDRWYHDLDKPAFTPPDPVFGAVWPALEAGLGVGGYRLLRAGAGPERTAALGLWFVNVAMIAGWTKAFFGERSLRGGVVVAAAQLGVGLAYVERARHVDRVAAAVGVPYVAWVAFANLLTEEVWRRNEPGRQG